MFDGMRMTDKAYGPDRSVLRGWNEHLKTLIKNFDLDGMTCMLRPWILTT